MSVVRPVVPFVSGLASFFINSATHDSGEKIAVAAGTALATYAASKIVEKIADKTTGFTEAMEYREFLINIGDWTGADAEKLVAKGVFVVVAAYGSAVGTHIVADQYFKGLVKDKKIEQVNPVAPQVKGLERAAPVP
jgi:hypothetical protein